jgi:hypothetical protein
MGLPPGRLNPVDTRCKAAEGQILVLLTACAHWDILCPQPLAFSRFLITHRHGSNIKAFAIMARIKSRAKDRPQASTDLLSRSRNMTMSC